MKIKIYFHDLSLPWEKYVEFIHLAFKERIEQGLNFGCATYSIETFKEKLKNAYTIFIVDDEENILGTVALTIHNNRGFIYGWHEYLAVSPKARGKKIGPTLENEILKLAKQHGLQFILSSTAFGAMSSIKFHKKVGFKKFAVKSYGPTNYYSFIFIKPVRYTIGTMFLLTLRLPLLLTTNIISHLFYKADGSKRF